MKKDYYHQSVRFDKDESSYKKLLLLQESYLDPTGKKYPLTTIIKMSILAFKKEQ